MNCVTCQKQLEAYLEGQQSERTRNEVEAHLSSCNECAELYGTMKLANRIMDQEKSEEPNPFLATRIMASIQTLEDVRDKQSNPFIQKVLKPIVISISIAAAAFLGVLSGGLYQTESTQKRVPLELSYVNDDTLESVDFYANN